MPTYFAKVEIIYCISAPDLPTAGQKAEQNFMALGRFDESRLITWADCQSSIAEAPSVSGGFTPALLIPDLKWELTDQFGEN